MIIVDLQTLQLPAAIHWAWSMDIARDVEGNRMENSDSFFIFFFQFFAVFAHHLDYVCYGLVDMNFNIFVTPLHLHSKMQKIAAFVGIFFLRFCWTAKKWKQGKIKLVRMRIDNVNSLSIIVYVI